MKKIRVDDCICQSKLVDHIKIKNRILEEINEQQERMITTYENEIKKLEQENAELKKELTILKEKNDAISK